MTVRTIRFWFQKWKEKSCILCCRSSCLREDCRKRFEEHGEIPSQDYTSWQQQVCWSSCDCWYYLSRVACWDSAEGWLGWPWKCIWFNAGTVNLLKNTNLMLLLKQKVRRVARSPLKGSPLNLFSQLFGQNKANTDPAVSSQHQGRIRWVSGHEQTALALWNRCLLPSTLLGMKRLVIPVSYFR